MWRDLELSMLEEVIQQKVEELVEQEQKLRRKSAPLLGHEELDQLLYVNNSQKNIYTFLSCCYVC